ncbi:MAG: tetratricopeptide repeat protein [Caldilineaceae bacterium]
MVTWTYCGEPGAVVAIVRGAAPSFTRRSSGWAALRTDLAKYSSLAKKEYSMSMTTAPTQTAKRRTWMFLAASLLIFAAAASLRLSWEGGAAVPAAAAAKPLDPVITWQARVERRPGDAGAYAGLGLALLQKVRETNDASLYPRAQGAFEQALARDPQQLDALVGRGMLALALHDFRSALALGDHIQALNPLKAAGIGVRVDALVELGRYAEAVTALQQMVDVRPDLESYSRISYLRELHGDVPGAIETMRMAADIALPGSEPWLWTTTYLGHLYWGQGDLAAAERIYRAVLRQKPDYAFAQFGLARIDAARGDKQTALTILRPLAARLPLPEFLAALGDLYAGLGDARQAQEQYDLVHVIQQLNAGAGMNVDLELATFDVMHAGDSEAALKAALAAAQVAYRERPTIYAADTLAWALHRTGDDRSAWRYSREALRLGTRDATLHAHAAAIAASLGDTAAAEQHREEVARINPYYSPWK